MVQLSLETLTWIGAVLALIGFALIATTLFALAHERHSRVRREAAATAQRRRVFAMLGSAMEHGTSLTGVPDRVIGNLLWQLRGGDKQLLCESVLGDGRVVSWRDQTHAWSARRRAEAAQLLGIVGDAVAVGDVERLIGDRDWRVRVVAARAAGTLGDVSLAGTLLDAVSDRKRPIPAGVVALAIARLGPDADMALLAGLGHADRRTRLLSTRMVPSVGVPHLVEQVLLQRCLVETDQEVRVALYEGLGRVGQPEESALVLVSALRDRSWQVRASAAHALGLIGVRDINAELVEALHDSHCDVRNSAARALMNLRTPAGDCCELARSSMGTARWSAWASSPRRRRGFGGTPPTQRVEQASAGRLKETIDG
jgi:HEAT repeat protein